MFAILATVMFVMTLYSMGIGSPAGEVLYRAAPSVLMATQYGVNNFFSPWIWEVFIARLLAQPAWTIPALLTILFTVLAILPGLRARPEPRLG